MASFFIVTNTIFITIEVVIVLVLSVMGVRKIGTGVAFRPILALVILTFWNYMGCLMVADIIPRTLPWVIALVASLIIVGIIIIWSLRVSPLQDKEKRLENILITYSWVLFGLLMAQLVTLEYNIITVDPLSLSIIPIYSRGFKIAFIIWGFLLVAFTSLLELKNGYHLNYLPGSAPKIYASGAILLSFGLTIILMQGALNPFKGVYGELWLFYVSRHLIFCGIILLKYATVWDPYALLPITRAVNHLVYTEQISIALISFESMGPAPLYAKGFHFLEDDEIEHLEFLIKMGAIGTSALGMGDQYIEGSAVIPVPNQPNLTALFLSSFVKDKSQTDPRFEGQNYVVLLLIVPSEVRWIIDKRQVLSEKYIKRIRTVEDLRSEFNSVQFIEYVRKGLLELAISV
ncbi:MAG: hypothetical protein INQ03_05850 [Candidatus Heimdallarchaeota archaeon]|nr:hypothetical protein [Candidatus Heimdallarchaeota archaeon]